MNGHSVVSTLRRYILPGLVFQSLVIAGGYGTGRELAEFFLGHGPVGGLLAMAVSGLVWSLVCSVSFEIARRFGTYDYRSFFRVFLGRGWVLFEMAYVVLLLIVLAVVASAAGTILEEMFGSGYWLGVIGVVAAVGLLTFHGSGAIERFLSGWSVLLYAVYAALFAWSLRAFGGDILGALATGEVVGAWPVGGVRYAAYNLAVVPAVLFSVRHATRTRDSIVAGLLAGPIAILPGVFMYLAMVGHYPGILDRPVPANFILEALGSRTFQVTFNLVLFGTLIETGSGLIHAVNERLARMAAEGGHVMSGAARSGVAFGFLALGTFLARFGIIDLIARGYGLLTWVFLLVYVAPVLTLGVARLRKGPADREVESEHRAVGFGDGPGP